MLDRLRTHWHEFKESEPGRRFQDRYRRKHGDRRHRFGAGSFVRVVAGAGLITAGMVMMVTPGPGIAVLLVGFSLLAGESIAMARMLDWTELRLTAAYHWTKQRWGMLSMLAQGAVVLVLVATAVAVVYGLYHVVFGTS